MNQYTTFSLHKIVSREDCPVNKEEYSRFKYGSKDISRKFAKEMSPKLFEWLQMGYLEEHEQVVIAPSPFMFIPAASFALKDYLIANLNPMLIHNGYKVVQETKVFRHTGYTADYGSMTKEQRKKMISSESFQTDSEFLRGKKVLFLDDIKITGSHQERVEEMIVRLKIDAECSFVYYAELQDSSSDPTIEDHLNYYSMKCLLDLDKIIKNEEFIFNVRNVKYILNAPHVDCVNFLEYQRHQFIETLYHYAIGNSYHFEPSYSMNFSYLKYLINKQP